MATSFFSFDLEESLNSIGFIIHIWNLINYFHYFKFNAKNLIHVNFQFSNQYFSSNRIIVNFGW